MEVEKTMIDFVVPIEDKRQQERQQGQVNVSPNVGWKRGAFSGLN